MRSDFTTKDGLLAAKGRADYPRRSLNYYGRGGIYRF